MTTAAPFSIRLPPLAVTVSTADAGVALARPRRATVLNKAITRERGFIARLISLVNMSRLAKALEAAVTVSYGSFIAMQVATRMIKSGLRVNNLASPYLVLGAPGSKVGSRIFAGMAHLVLRDAKSK